MKDDYFEPYADPEFWNLRGPIHSGRGAFARIFNLYCDFNDNSVRKRVSALPGVKLDAGCGEGRLLPYASVGVDFSAGMLERAKRKRVPLVRASVQALPFRDGAFNSAFMTDVMVHIKPEERKKVVDELRRTSSKYIDFGAQRRTLFYRIKQLLPPRRVFSFVALALSIIGDRFMLHQSPFVATEGREAGRHSPQ